VSLFEEVEQVLKRICMYQCTLGYNVSLTYLLCIYLKREDDHYVEQVRVDLLKQVEQVLVIYVCNGITCMYVSL